MSVDLKKKIRLLIIGTFNSEFIDDYIDHINRENIEIDLLTTVTPKKKMQ